MTPKSIVRLILGILVAVGLLMFALPAIGIPKGVFLPPPVVYSGAKGITQGRVTGKRELESGNPFKVGTKVFLIDYSFRAPTPKRLGATGAGKPAAFTGTIGVEQGVFNSVQPGAPVPIRYEKTNPAVNGINAKGMGRGGDGFIGGWILFTIVALGLGFAIAPLFERIIRRDDF